MADTHAALSGELHFPADPGPRREWLAPLIDRLPLEQPEREFIMAIAGHDRAERDGRYIVLEASPVEIAALIGKTDRQIRRTLRPRCERYGLLTFEARQDRRPSAWRIDMGRLIDAPPAADDLYLARRRPQRSHTGERTLFDGSRSPASENPGVAGSIPAACSNSDSDDGRSTTRRSTIVTAGEGGPQRSTIAQTGDAASRPSGWVVRAFGLIVSALSARQVRTSNAPGPDLGPDVGPDLDLHETAEIETGPDLVRTSPHEYENEINKPSSTHTHEGDDGAVLDLIDWGAAPRGVGRYERGLPPRGWTLAPSIDRAEFNRATSLDAWWRAAAAAGIVTDDEDGRRLLWAAVAYVARRKKLRNPVGLLHSLLSLRSMTAPTTRDRRPWWLQLSNADDEAATAAIRLYESRRRGTDQRAGEPMDADAEARQLDARKREWKARMEREFAR